MENLEETNRNQKENIHKPLCTECPAYNECMSIWLDYFIGKRYRV
jgi:hypothetical protein